ncbi:MAG TPA: hypothetical protein VMF61_17445, partial [Candidatus Acidoferrales bacterium]|nr:hypothetical protein [Candidatus Acidoferrales bacterium]
MRSTFRTSPSLTICREPLRGRGGEPIAFERTVLSHGCAQLAPARLDRNPLVYRRRFRTVKATVEVSMRAEDGFLIASCEEPVDARSRARIATAIGRMFRLDDDLSPFYASIAERDPLRWAVQGAGRMLASPTVFEDVVKTICTTNCTWSATQRMTAALAERGDGAFPDAERLAATPDSWYRDVARMGYRGPHVRAVAGDVAAGNLDLESLLPGRGRNDDEVREALLALPGIGPYAAAHVMQLLGR